MYGHERILKINPQPTREGVMNWKLVIVGGLVFWVVTNVVGFGVASFIDEGVLDPIYRANSEFWLPELNQDPPDIAALMPFWLTTSLIASLVFAGIYSKVRGSFTGPGWRRGLGFAVCLALLYFVFMLGWSGIFNLPGQLWFWWGVEALILYLIAGAVMGWVGERWAPA
jgi:dipeptide/tripeptide permease